MVKYIDHPWMKIYKYLYKISKFQDIKNILLSIISFFLIAINHINHAYNLSKKSA